jgi:hypothetical protein
MNIKREKNKQARIVLPPDSRYHIKTPDHLFEHHVIFCAVGPRGASKTTKICNYLRMMRQANKLDRLLIVSPTVKSNQALLDSLGVRPEDCFEPSADATKKVLAVVNEERDAYEEFLDKDDAYHEYLKAINSHTPIDQLDAYTLLDATDEWGNPQKPKSRYGHRPIIAVFFDDAQSTPAFRARAFSRMCLTHRHVGALKYHKGGGRSGERLGALGISIFLACQNFKATGGGLRREIRNNCTQLCLCGKSKDEAERKAIYKSVSGNVTEDEFNKALEYATKEKYGSLTIDFHPKSPGKRFRKNFDEYIHV